MRPASAHTSGCPGPQVALEAPGTAGPGGHSSPACSTLNGLHWLLGLGSWIRCSCPSWPAASSDLPAAACISCPPKSPSLEKVLCILKCSLVCAPLPTHP